MSLDAASYEKLGAFYLGRPYDVAAGAAVDAPLLYDAKDLSTHAVCRRDDRQRQDRPGHRPDRGGGDRRHPGDGHRSQGRPRQPAADLPRAGAGRTSRPGSTRTRPRRQGATRPTSTRSPPGRALARTAWPSGARTASASRACATAADFADLHAGQRRRAAAVGRCSRSQAPPPAVRADGDLLCASAWPGTGRSLLALLGIDADPVQQPRAHPARQRCSSRPGRQGRDLDLGGLIQRVQPPPFDRVGVMRRWSRSTRPRSASSWR